jgi:hypothetical protein
MRHRSTSRDRGGKREIVGGRYIVEWGLRGSTEREKEDVKRCGKILQLERVSERGGCNAIDLDHGFANREREIVCVCV